MSGRPYPTPNRLKILREIEREELRHYRWVAKPRTWNTVTDRERTAAVAEFVAAGLADHGTPEEPGDVDSYVQLTASGREYLDTYGKNGADT